jgi:hypothetical protein
MLLIFAWMSVSIFNLGEMQKRILEATYRSPSPDLGRVIPYSFKGIFVYLDREMTDSLIFWERSIFAGIGLIILILIVSLVSKRRVQK